MDTPNLFDYATKELSQDAVICWLIACSAHDGDVELRRLGRHFVESLLSNKRDDRRPVPDAITEVKILQQEKHIDVLARINGGDVLLIEDKTDSDPHGNQLARYRREVLAGETELGPVPEEALFPIYFKTGNQPLGTEQTIEMMDSGYKVFSRGDFLAVLNTYQGTNAIVLDFKRRLQLIEDETQSFRKWRRDGVERQWPAWQGLFRELEERLWRENAAAHWRGWGYVPNPAGGFLGFWWKPLELPAVHPAYLQLEWEELCFKVEAGDCSAERRDELKWEWNKRLTSQHERVVKPRVMRRGSTMTVAKHACGWLRFDQGNALDLDATIASLREAERILVAAAAE